MKVLLIILEINFIHQSIFGQFSEENDPDKHSQLINKITVNKINNKSIQFYLNHPKIDEYSKMYYKGKFAPSDDSMTFGFLDSVMTKNSETRPFYFFVFNQIVNVADGALAEGIAFKCLDYVAKYPCEFLNHAKNDTLVTVDIWLGLLSFAQYDVENIKKIDMIEAKVKQLCPNCLNNWIALRKRIVKSE